MLGEAFLCLLLNKMSSNPQPKKIVILSDGKPGHYNQSLGIMDQLSDDEYQLVEINFRSKWHDNILRIFLSLFPGGKLTDKVIWSILFFSLTEETISKLTKGAAYYRDKGIEHNVFNNNNYPYSFIEVEMVD